ncbi:Cna B-type domain-containing protein [Bifidobacterium sp. SO4]|uniref:Cna B-type domain-containing protein n=1 Tax=Bifidobacterium sp. SO4 TaxID=2809030 RepID=UPI001BDC0CF7|nr:Cna B-type domain-containing protein [Bifidobacterium sp. SO4]MBT1171536.1 Cna B-type domain-containing protein [Bifidobacterium sp. SO4]
MLVVIAMLLATAIVGVPAAQAANTYEIGSAQAPVLKDDTEITIDGKPYTTGMTVNYGDPVKMKLYWTMPNNANIQEGDQFTYDLPKGLNFKSNETYTIYGNDGGERGTFTVNGNKLVATFDRSDTGSNKKIYVTVNGTITESSTGDNNGGKASFEFPGVGQLEVNVNEQHSLWAQKNGAISTDDPTVFDFVVEVHAKGSNKNVKLEDKMGELLKLVPGSLKLYTDPNCTKEYTGKWESTEQTDTTPNGFTANIDQMTDGQALYARYSVKIDRKQVADNVGTELVKNKVTYHSDDYTKKQTTEQSIWLNSKWSVKKNGKANTVDKTDENGKPVLGKDGKPIQVTMVNWTITVNAGTDSEVPNATTIKDSLGSNLKAPTGDVKVVYYDDNWQPYETTLKWADLVSGKATLPSNGKHPYQQYKITYSTEVENLPESGSGDKVTVQNNVTVTPGDGKGTALPGTGTVTIGKDAVDLDKKYTGDANADKTLQWLTTFKAKDDLPKGKVLTDTVDDDGKDHGDGYVKPDSQVLDPDASKIKIYTDSELTKEYNGDVTKTVAADRKSFTITFNDEIKKNTKLYISYTSTVLNGTPTGTTFYNTARFVNKEATDSHKPVADNMEKSNLSNQNDGNGTPMSRNTMRWQLKVHDIPDNAQSVVITDTLSHGEKAPDNNWQYYGDHSYIPGSMVAKDSKGNTYTGVTVTDNGDHTLTFVIAKGSKAFEKAQSGELLIQYDTTFTDITGALGQQGNLLYKNEAIIHIDGKAQLPDYSDIWAKPGNLVAKKGVYDKKTAPNINYTVNVNPGGSTLNKGKSLTLTDTLGEALTLRMDSVVITDTNTKAEVTGATYAYDPSTRKITFTVPDSRAITITYKATVQLKPGQDFGDLGSNTIVLAGYENNSGTATTTQTGKVIDAQGGISSNLYSLQIYKYADGDATKPLNGAKFKVEKLTVDMDASNDAWSSTGTEVVNNGLQSGTTGYTSTAVGLNADVIYRVTETQGPDGYQYDPKNPATLYVVFPGGQPSGHEAAFYQDKTVNDTSLTVAAARDVTLQNYLWSVSNASTKKGSFKLDKKDEQGNWLAGATFTLTKNGDSSFAAQTQTTADGQSIEFKDLTPGSYTLTETTAPEGYQAVDPIAVTVTNAGAVIINGKTVSSDDGKHLTVTDRSNVTSIRARKVWNDDNNRDGKRKPARFQLQKSTDGGTTWTNVGQEKVINESTSDAQAVVEWTDLPVREGGKEVKYQVIEVNAGEGGYDTTRSDPVTGADGVSTTTFTNKYTPETVSVPVTKAWNDANNQDGLRPTEITVQLYANGVAVPDKTLTIKPDADGHWKGTFDNLPRYENGAPITYTVQEVNPTKGYTATTSGTATDADGITITNTHYPTDTKIRVSKRDLGGKEIKDAEMEIDGTDEDGNKVTEKWTSSKGKSHEVELKPGTYTLTELKAPNGYRVADPITFKVVRNADQSLSVQDVNGNAVDGNVIVMTDIYKTTDVKISKVSLTGGVGEIAGAKLTVTGTTLAGEAINPIEWTSTGKKHEITLVPGTYTLHEAEAPSGYQPARDITFTVKLNGTVKVGKDTAAGNTVTMTDELNTTNVTVSKTAVAGVAELAGAEFKLTGTTFEGDAAPFDTDAFTKLDGVTVKENGSTLTWTSSADGPKTFQLPNGTYQLTETKAPEGYDVAAKPITFTVENGKVVVDEVASSGNVVRVEDAVKSYTAVSVTKRWEDGGAQDLRKDVTVKAVLYKNGEKMTGKEYSVVLDDSNNWTYDWTGLDAKDNEGNEITYTVDEELSGDNKDEYHASIVKTPNANGYDVVMYNIHQPDARNIDLTKTWKDNDNQDGIRPEAIQVTVTGTSKHPKDGSTTETEEYSETMIVTTLKVPDNADKNTWKWTLENLPKKNSYGYEYTYSVKETPVAGYNDFDDSGVCTVDKPTGDQCNVTFTKTSADADEKTNEQFEITNTHKPETTAVTVSKVWDDAQNFNGQRPKQVTVWLLTSLWNQSNGWPEPQGDQCVGDLVGVSCAVLTAKNKATTGTSDATQSDTTDGTDTNTTDPDTTESESTPSKTEQTGSESTEQSQSGKTEQSGTDQSETTPSETDQSDQSDQTASEQSESSDQPADGDATATDQTDTETPAGESNETDSKSDATKAATADTWTYTFNNLPKYRNGKLLRYSVTEEAVDDYTATFEDTTKYPTTSAPSEGGNTDTSATQTTTGEPEAYSFTLSNRNAPNKTNLNVRKAWNDNDDNTRPRSIWVQLYEKNVSTTSAVFANVTTAPKITNTDTSNLTAVGEPVELNESNNWAYTFTISTHKQYEVREVAKNDGKYVPVPSIDGYQPPIITGNQTQGYTITNTSLPILPEAGGEGTTRILLLGMTLIALSGAFFGRKALAAAGKRNKKGDLR